MMYDFTHTRLGLIPHICVVKNNSHFPVDAYMHQDSSISPIGLQETYKVVRDQDMLTWSNTDDGCKYEKTHITWHHM